MYFQEFFIWLAQEHHLSQFIDAPGGSFWLLESLWASMVALGGSWRKYMKTIVFLIKTDTFHSLRLFWTSPKKYSLDHSKCMKTIVLSTSGSKARKPSNQASWGWFWWLLEPRLESHGTILHQKTFWYRVIVPWVICSWVLRLLLTEPAGDPRKKCVRKSVSIIICPPPLAHHTLYCYLQSRHSTKCNVLML